MKILIGAPVRNREWILEQYLEHIFNLDYKKKDIGMYFVLNDSIDKSEQILKKFKNKFEKLYRFIDIDKKDFGAPMDKRTADIRSQHIIPNLVELRNIVRQRFKKDRSWGLFSIDTDTLISDQSLNRAIRLSKEKSADIVGLFVDVDYGINRLGNMMNFVDGTDVARHIINPNPQYGNVTWTKEMKVDVVGGCCLYRRIIIDAGIKWRLHQQGEDVGLCWDAKQEGLNVWIICDPLAKHVMRRDN